MHTYIDLFLHIFILHEVMQLFPLTCSNRSCSINNGGCEQNCTTLEGIDGFLCHSQDGFIVSDVDVTSCVDVDECATFGSNNFPQNCLNVKVTCFLCQYTCVCVYVCTCCRIFFL